MEDSAPFNVFFLSDGGVTPYDAKFLEYVRCRVVLAADNPTPFESVHPAGRSALVTSAASPSALFRRQ